MAVPPLSPLQRLFLLRVLVAGGELFVRDAEMTTLAAKDRKQLVALGLTHEEKRSRVPKRPKSDHVELTDAGWAYLGERFDGPLPARPSKASHFVFARLAASVGRHLQKHPGAIAELFRVEPPVAALAERIRQTYFRLASDRPNVRVRLADLRRGLPDVPRATLDETLLRLEREGGLTLYPIDNPVDVRADDREAILRTPSGEPRHVVFLGGARS